jgi:hypothetical protein
MGHNLREKINRPTTSTHKLQGRVAFHKNRLLTKNRNKYSIAGARGRRAIPPDALKMHTRL